MAQVFVGNLKPWISDATIEKEFLAYSSNASQSVRIARKSPNYAFVDFDDPNDALLAIFNLDGRHGWKVKLSNHSRGGSGRGRGGRHFANDNYGIGVTPNRKIGTRTQSIGKNEFNGDIKQEAGLKQQIRGNKASGNGDLPAVGIPVDKDNVISGHGNRDKVRSKQDDILESEKPPFDELAQKDVVINSLKAEIEEKERKLEAVGKENERLKSRLNEATTEISSAKARELEMTWKLKNLGEELEKSSNHVSLSNAKAEDMSVMLKKLGAELEKSKTKESSAKAKEAEMNMKLKQLSDEFEKSKNNTAFGKSKGNETSLKWKQLEEELRCSKKNVVQLNQRLKVVEGEKMTLETEMKNLRVKAEEWRKAADAAATIFSVGVLIDTEISKAKPLVSGYCNRATTKFSLGNVREALWYCSMAAAVDPDFREVYLLAAKCHLLLGEIEDALCNYNKCLHPGNIFCLDRRITIEAADGIQMAQKVITCIKQSSELLQQKTSVSATKALGVIGEALSISLHSENLLEMKGEALLVLRKYEEVVQLCERTLDFAEKNFPSVAVANHKANESSKNFLQLWRWNLMSRSYICLGRLEIALNFIEKQEQLRSTDDKSHESLSALAVTVRELLHLKNVGNEAFRSGRHSEAVEHYSDAISKNTESRPFLAVCFCNRAAARQALGEIIDAIADCSLAIALDSNYRKAFFRRAVLHERIRDYEQAANDLQRYIAVLENQSLEKSQEPVTPDRQADCCAEDLRRTRCRLSCLEEKAQKGLPLDPYLILGLKVSDTAAEIKKAYRKAALKHHPDKAGQALPRIESGDDGKLWMEITDPIFKDADRLFKAIGEAYGVLSDSSKKSQYDLKEGMRRDQH